MHGGEGVNIHGVQSAHLNVEGTCEYKKLLNHQLVR